MCLLPPQHRRAHTLHEYSPYGSRCLSFNHRQDACLWFLITLPLSHLAAVFHEFFTASLFDNNIKPEMTSTMRHCTVCYQLVYWIFLCLCPAGAHSPDVGWKRELKGLLLAVETQEALGAKRDHLAGGGPTPLPLRQLKELSGYMSLALTGCSPAMEPGNLA